MRAHEFTCVHIQFHFGGGRKIKQSRGRARAGQKENCGNASALHANWNTETTQQNVAQSQRKSVPLTKEALFLQVPHTGCNNEQRVVLETNVLTNRMHRDNNHRVIIIINSLFCGCIVFTHFILWQPCSAFYKQVGSWLFDAWYADTLRRLFHRFYVRFASTIVFI